MGSHQLQQGEPMKLIYGACGILALTGCVTTGGRDYVANPFYLPPAPQTTQPNFQPFGSQTNGYELILINTPNGLVQKRCKMVNGQVAHCL